MALISELIAKKPSTAKGIYLRSITLSTTMGLGFRIDTTSVVAKSEDEAGWNAHKRQKPSRRSRPSSAR